MGREPWAASILIRVQQGFLQPEESYAGRTPRRVGLLLLGGKDSQAGWTPRREGLSGGKTPRRNRLLGEEDSYSWWESRGCV